MTQSVVDVGQIRLKSCALTFYGTDFVCRKTCFTNPWFVDHSHALTSCWDFYAVRRRRRNEPAAANISIKAPAGSGTAAIALALDPLPGGWPKWARQTV